MKKLFSTFILITAVSGCASLKTTTVPDSVSKAPEPDFQYAEVLDDNEKFVGSKIRWGGEIVKVNRSDINTRITVIERPILENGRPDYIHDNSKRPSGRFIVELNPSEVNKALRRNRFIVVYGEVTGFEELAIKDHIREIPVIKALNSYVWHNRNNQYLGHHAYHRRHHHIHSSLCAIDHFYYPRYYYSRFYPYRVW